MKNKILVLSAFLLVITIFSAWSRPVTIKLGTPTPTGSDWDNALRRLAVEWNEITNGQVTVKVYSDGIAGKEADMVRKMRLKSLQSAVVAGEGLTEIAPDSLILSIPMLIQSEEEFNYVFQKIKPQLEKDMEEAGFKMIAWTMAGWMHFFSKKPVIYPEDLKKHKIAAADTDQTLAPILKSMGFTTIPLTLNEIMASLTSGMVEACYTVPLGAASYQWFGIAKNMCALPLSPAVGGVVVSLDAWEQIPEKFRPSLLASAEKLAKELGESGKKLEKEVMQVMRTYGLVVNEVPPDAKAAWMELFTSGVATSPIKKYSESMYGEVVRYLDGYRKLAVQKK